MALPEVGDQFKLPTANGEGLIYEVSGVVNAHVPPYVGLRPPADSGRRDYGWQVDQADWDEWEARAVKLT
jgi:hypothetical protein